MTDTIVIKLPFNLVTVFLPDVTTAQQTNTDFRAANARITRAGNVRVTRTGNARVTRGHYPDILSYPELIAVKLFDNRITVNIP